MDTTFGQVSIGASQVSVLETRVGRLINLHYGRLLATKEELLDEWNEEFLEYEVNRIEERAVMTRGYTELIANVQAQVTVDTNLMARECLEAAKERASDKWDGTDLQEKMALEESELLCLSRDLEDLDQWFTEHLYNKLVLHLTWKDLL